MQGTGNCAQFKAVLSRSTSQLFGYVRAPVLEVRAGVSQV